MGPNSAFSGQRAGGEARGLPCPEQQGQEMQATQAEAGATLQRSAQFCDALKATQLCTLNKQIVRYVDYSSKLV